MSNEKRAQRTKKSREVEGKLGCEKEERSSLTGGLEPGEGKSQSSSPASCPGVAGTTEDF